MDKMLKDTRAEESKEKPEIIPKF